MVAAVIPFPLRKACIMVKFDKADLLQLLAELGFETFDMQAPMETIKGVEVRAVNRRVYRLASLRSELDSLWSYGVRCIGVYQVCLISSHGSLSYDKGIVSKDGVSIRWATYTEERYKQLLRECPTILKRNGLQETPPNSQEALKMIDRWKKAFKKKHYVPESDCDNHRSHPVGYVCKGCLLPKTQAEADLWG